jgi:bifunctional N-acetylglucosamine-1-phosphate-uridyltransferase/glucosamine-1-phosphate-acetyltransferase GlmU-like protein
MKICAVIPAAGRGTRLGNTGPKILTRLNEQDTIWSVLQQKLAPLVDHIHVVLSPEGIAAFPPQEESVSHSIQPVPTGMGDAIFRGYQTWSQYDAVLIVWGDQVFVSSDTLMRAIDALEVPGPQAVLPVTRMESPYVEYAFEGGTLRNVFQTREGDITTPNGFSDVGTFLLTTGGLKAAWEDYLAQAIHGGQTGEINFLPFLPFLALHGWPVMPLEVADATEARGINTQADLDFFRELYRNA